MSHLIESQQRTIQQIQKQQLPQALLDQKRRGHGRHLENQLPNLQNEEAQEESVFTSDMDEEHDKLVPIETFVGMAYHSNITHRKSGDEDEPMPITEFSQLVVASELESFSGDDENHDQDGDE